MYGVTELEDRIIIIKNSNIDDAEILNKNYLSLMHQANDIEERKQLLSLHSMVSHRIKKLKKHHTESKC